MELKAIINDILCKTYRVLVSLFFSPLQQQSNLVNKRINALISRNILKTNLRNTHIPHEISGDS